MKKDLKAENAKLRARLNRAHRQLRVFKKIGPEVRYGLELAVDWHFEKCSLRHNPETPCSLCKHSQRWKELRWLFSADGVKGPADDSGSRATRLWQLIEQQRDALKGLLRVHHDVQIGRRTVGPCTGRCDDYAKGHDPQCEAARQALEFATAALEYKR